MLILEGCRGAAGLIILPGHRAQTRRDLAQVITADVGAGQDINKTNLPDFAVSIAQIGARLRGSVEHLLATFVCFKKARFEQFAQRIIDRVRVLNIQQETNVSQALFTTAVIGVVQHQNFEWREIGIACRIHRDIHRVKAL